MSNRLGDPARRGRDDGPRKPHPIEQGLMILVRGQQSDRQQAGGGCVGIVRMHDIGPFVAKHAGQALAPSPFVGGVDVDYPQRGRPRVLARMVT